MKRIILILGVVSLYFPNLFAQERFGISNSMYAGISSDWLNPSSIAASPYRMDFNIVALHSYFDNNYMYLGKTNFLKLAADAKKNANLDSLQSSSMTFMVDNTWNRNHGEDTKYKLEDMPNNSFQKNCYYSLLIQGPSLMINVKKWTFAVTSAFRTAVSATGFDKDGAKLLFEGLTYTPLQQKDMVVSNLRINSMAWNEIGATAAKVIIKDQDKLIKVGVTLKHLTGYAAAFYNCKEMDLYVPNDTDLYVKKLDLKYGYGVNEKKLTDSTGTYFNNALDSHGGGISMDFGITYERKKVVKTYQCANFCNKTLELQYLWKAGLSLIDIGYVHFNDYAQTFDISDKSDYWWNFNKLQVKNGLAGIDTTLSEHFVNSPIPIVLGNKFTMLTPWALSAQFTYNIGYNFFVNATWVQRLPHFGLPGIDRVNSLSVTPMYEIRRIGVAMPIVMYNYVWPRVGLAVRLNNFLVIGTDKLGAIIGNRISGEDIYFALKFNLLKKCPKESKSLIN